jgi:hypothetical protein
MRTLDAFGAPRRLAAQDGETAPPAAGQDGMVSSPVLNPDGDHSEPLTYGNRLGLALMELVEHLPTDRLPAAGGGSATVVVTMTLEQLRSGLGSTALDTGVEASAGQARRLACNAQLVPMVLGGDSQPLDLGRARRLFSPPQRLALAHRDGGCVWRGCARPPSWCEAHHPHPWSEGGPTDVRNGALLCPFHHRLLHTGDWVLRIARDGIPEVIPPARIDEARRPMRHARFTRPPGRHPD